MTAAAFIGFLDVRLVDDQANEGRGEWELLDRFGFHSALFNRDVYAEKGEMTDFASVPRAPLVFLVAGDRGHKAAVIHDHNYRTQEVDRETADEMLKEALIVEGFSQEEADAWFFGVRMGGESHYGTASPIAISAPPSSSSSLA